MTDFTQQELEYLTAAVGPEKAGYYLPKFARFAAGGSPLSWNWPCFFVTFFWLLYRKMWLWAVLYMVLPAALFFVLGLISVFTSYWAYAAGTIVYWIGIFIVLPMYANVLYYQHIRKKVTLVADSIGAPERAIAYLGSVGGASGVAATVAAVVFSFYFIAVAGILAAIAIPAYQDYVIRAKVAGIYFATEPARQSLENIFTYDDPAFESVPVVDIDERVQAGEDSAMLSYDPAEGVLWVRFETGKLADKTLELVPYLTENNQVIWECSSEDINDNWLPASCRSDSELE